MLRPSLTPEEFAALVDGLRAQPRETQWLEFKENFSDPNGIGEYISALSNSAVLVKAPRAYLVWGLEDSTHDIVGTTFDLKAAKKGNEDLENWLVRLLDPQPSYQYMREAIDGKYVAVLEINAASHRPVRFNGMESIRLGSYTKKLQDHPELERQLWRNLDATPFELGLAADGLDSSEVLQLIDYTTYFDLVDKPLPVGSTQVLKALQSARIIEQQLSGRWGITNVGALLFAKRLADFDSLARKAPRVIRYHGNNRVQTQREQVGTKGYASGFTGLIDYIDGLVPANEVIGKALRETVSMYPPLAVRELIANALIHQDFAATGTGPMFELFDDRFEISNPGVPLIDPGRFVDAQPQSRNEKLAWMMRQCHICEERGTGWDKIGFEIEFNQLPAPVIRTTDSHTTVVLFGHKPLSKMDREDRIRAVYLHACLRYVIHEDTTNSSVRERFGIEAKNAATATRYITEALAANVIVARDPAAGRKNMSYIPAWAAEE